MFNILVKEIIGGKIGILKTSFFQCLHLHKNAKQCYFKRRKCTLKLFTVFKMAYSCCSTWGENKDFLPNKRFNNIHHRKQNYILKKGSNGSSTINWSYEKKLGIDKIPYFDPHIGTSAEDDNAGREELATVNVAKMAIEWALKKIEFENIQSLNENLCW